MAKESTGFSFSKFMEDIGEQHQLTQQRQQEQVKAQKVIGLAQQRSRDAAAEYDRNADPLRKSILATQAKKQHARQLADSGNPLDVLRLMGLQASDPGGYKRTTRMARLAEDSTILAATGAAHNVRQQSIEADIMAATTGLDMAKLQESIGLEKLKQLQVDAALLTQSFEASQTMQNGAIHGMDEKQLAAAIQGAKVSNATTANISGVEVDVTTLEDRMFALKKRRHEIMVQDTALALDEDSNKNISETIKQREYERKLAADERKRLPHTLAYRSFEQEVQETEMKNKDATIGAKNREAKLQRNENSEENIQADITARNFERYRRNKEVIEYSQQQELDTYNSEELLTLRQNGYVTSDGRPMNRDFVEQAYDRRLKVENDAVMAKVYKQQLAGFDRTQLTKESQRLDTIMPRFRENTPAAQASRQYGAALGFLSDSVDSPDQLTKQVAYAAYLQAREKFDAVIVAQAKKESNGDPNKETLLTEFYRGNPVPLATLNDAVVERLTGTGKGKTRSLADILPQNVALAVERYYSQALEAETKGDYLGQAPSAEDTRLRKERAAQKAIEWGITDSIKGRQELILTNQVMAPGHPLMGWTPNQMGVAMKIADERAKTGWIARHGLKPEEADAILRGEDLTGRSDSAQLLADLRHSENVQFLEDLNGREPGLGSKVATWWQERGSEYLAREQEVYDRGVVTTNFEQSSFRALSGQQEQQSMFEYGMGLGASDSSMIQDTAQRRADYLAFGGNQEHAQVALLQMDDNLQPEEKKTILAEVISPLMVEASQRGLSFQEQRVFLEKGIMTFESSDKEVMRVLKLFKRNRSDNVRQLNKLQNLWALSETNRTFTNSLFSKDFLPQNPVRADVDWYKEWKNQQPAVPTTP